MTRREQLVDDAAEVAALLEQPDDAEDAQLVDELGDVPDDDSPTPTREQVHVAALLCAHATSGTDLDDLAGVLGYPACTPDDVDDEPVDEQHDHDGPCDRCGSAAGRCCAHCSGWRLPTSSMPCEICGANVTAEKIAETGRIRHPWHEED